MYVDVMPGSRLKVCDICGMQILESYPGHFVPHTLIDIDAYDQENMCPECRDIFDTYIRRSIRKCHWARFGVVEV